MAHFCLFSIFPFLFFIIFCFFFSICLFTFFHDSILSSLFHLNRMTPQVCPSLPVNIYKNNLLQDSGPVLTAQGCSQARVCLRACLCMFVCSRGKNRCSRTFRLGFLILATNRPVIYVIVLLLWPKHDWKRDEGTEGRTEGLLDRT